ncbi:hypothetical protein BC828DRAFT_384364, partial [Blastocladiella britannica]
KLERRAVNIRETSILRSVQELNALNWTPASLLFLDKVSFDNRGMLRTRGYGQVGKPVRVKGGGLSLGPPIADRGGPAGGPALSIDET